MICKKEPTQPIDILIIDDDDSRRDRTARLLESVGYGIIEAENGAEGVRLASLHRPEIILLNVILPDINGLDLWRKLKALPGCAESRLVLMSEDTLDPESRIDDCENGAKDYIVRPISDRELLARIRLIARLKYAEDSLQQHKDDVERVIAERMAELRAVNERLRQEVTERKQAEKELSRLSAAMAASIDGILIIDIEGHIVDVNDAVLKKHGIAHKKDMLGKMAFEFIAPEDRENAFAAMQKVIEKGYLEGIAYHILTRDNRKIPVEANVVIMEDEDGTSAGFVTTVRDVTERKRVEEALRESEARYRMIFEHSLNGILLNQLDGKILAANPEACRLLGYTEIELLELERPDIVDPTDPQTIAAMTERTHTGKFRGELTYRRRDGAHIPVEVSSMVFTDPHGVPKTTIFFTDITDRKRAEMALRESEQKYRSVIENIQDVFYRSDLKGCVLMGSPSGTGMFGFDSVEEMIGMPLDSFWPDPQERQQILDQIKATGSVRDYEAVLRKKDGSTFNAAFTTHFYYDDQGNVLGTEGIIRNITGRKRIEQALRESEEKLRAQYDNIPIPTYTWQRIGDGFRLVDYNKAAGTAR